MKKKIHKDRRRFVHFVKLNVKFQKILKQETNNSCITKLNQTNPNSQKVL